MDLELKKKLISFLLSCNVNKKSDKLKSNMRF